MKTAYGYNNVVIKHNDYKDINENINSFLDSKEYMKYDLIYMTDITGTDETMARINKIIGHKFILLDHHKSAEHLNQYFWSNIIAVKNGVKTCATTLVFEHCLDKGLYDNLSENVKNNMSAFAEVVRSYDTFEWKENRYEYPNTVDLIRKIKGNKRFIKELVQNNYIVSINNDEQLELDKRNKQYEHYVKNKLPQIVEITLKSNNRDLKLGVVEAHSSLSLLGNDLSYYRTDLDGIAMIAEKYGNISYRTCKNIDLSVHIKHLFGGGGHPKACGSQIKDSKLLIDTYNKAKKETKFYKKLNNKANLERILFTQSDYLYKCQRLAIGILNLREQCNDVNILEQLDLITLTDRGLLIEDKHSKYNYLVNLRGVLKINTELKTVIVEGIVPIDMKPLEWYDRQFRESPESMIFGMSQKLYPKYREIINSAHYLRTPLEYKNTKINRKTINDLNVVVPFQLK